MPFESIISAVGLPGPRADLLSGPPHINVPLLASSRVGRPASCSLAPTGSHRCNCTALAGHGPGSEANWRVCQRGRGRRGPRHRPRYRGGSAGAALRCRHQLIAMAAGHGRAAGCEWCSTWTSNPTEAPGARRDAACQILRKPAVGESPFLRAHYQQCTPCGTL